MAEPAGAYVAPLLLSAISDHGDSAQLRADHCELCTPLAANFPDQPPTGEAGDIFQTCRERAGLVAVTAMVLGAVVGVESRVIKSRRVRDQQHNLKEISAWLAAFFFRADAGIRDGTVPGVQTCALPI